MHKIYEYMYPMLDRTWAVCKAEINKSIRVGVLAVSATGLKSTV